MTPTGVREVRAGPQLVVGFPAITGTADHVIELADHLPAEWGVLACSTTNIEPREIPSSVPELAARYVELLSDRLRDVPVVLGGWGFGGMLAIEVQRMLLRRGFDVRGMFAVGSFIPPPEFRTRPSDVATLAPVFVRHIAAWAETPTPAGLSLDLSAGPASAVFAALSAIGLADGIDEAHVERALRRFQRHVIAFHAYDPEPVEGRVLVLYPEAEPNTARMHAGWSRVAPQHERGQVPGDHLSVMARRHRAAIATALAPLLNG